MQSRHRLTVAASSPTTRANPFGHPSRKTSAISPWTPAVHGQPKALARRLEKAPLKRASENKSGCCAALHAPLASKKRWRGPCRCVSVVLSARPPATFVAPSPPLESCSLSRRPLRQNCSWRPLAPQASPLASRGPGRQPASPHKRPRSFRRSTRKTRAPEGRKSRLSPPAKLPNR